MSVLTLIMLLFTIILYAFLAIVYKEIRIKAVSGKKHKYLVLIISIFMTAFLFMTSSTLDGRIRGILAGLIFLSFIFDSQGLTEERFIINALDIRGIPFEEVNRVVLYQEQYKAPLKMNFFRNGLRGPMLKFDQPLEELSAFLAEHLQEGTAIEVLTDQDTK